MSWDGINPVIDVKDGMHCNIPWPRWDGSVGGVRCECTPSYIGKLLTWTTFSNIR